MSEVKAVYFDCYSGISGDMTLGALVDLGVDIGKLKGILDTLGLPGWDLKWEKVNLYGLTATSLSVDAEEQHRHRHLSDILRLIDHSGLPQQVKEKSSAIFNNLAEAEAAVHGSTVEQVHFHEVGAVDAIVDIVGSVTALFLLGVEKVYCSPLPLGRGMVRSAHGLIPLPAPAALELFKRHQVPVYGKDIELELVTPTGAAIIATLADGFGPPPQMIIEATGSGAGKLDPGYPNLLRMMLGALRDNGASWEETVQIIEANIDDMNPEIFGFLMDKLLEEGALDVFFTPIQMKKNRPAVKLSVLSSPASLDTLVKIINNETSTLGLRVMQGRKIMRPRQIENIETPWGAVRVKIVPAREGDSCPPQHFAPEYADCLKAARESGLPLKEIYRRVEYLFNQRYFSS